jgi:hypothetical protein
MELWDYQLVWPLVQFWLTLNTASKAPSMPISGAAHAGNLTLKADWRLHIDPLFERLTLQSFANHSHRCK